MTSASNIAPQLLPNATSTSVQPPIPLGPQPSSQAEVMAQLNAVIQALPQIAAAAASSCAQTILAMNNQTISNKAQAKPSSSIPQNGNFSESMSDSGDYEAPNQFRKPRSTSNKQSKTQSQRANRPKLNQDTTVIIEERLKVDEETDASTLTADHFMPNVGRAMLTSDLERKYAAYIQKYGITNSDSAIAVCRLFTFYILSFLNNCNKKWESPFQQKGHLMSL